METPVSERQDVPKAARGQSPAGSPGMWPEASTVAEARSRPASSATGREAVLQHAMTHWVHRNQALAILSGFALGLAIGAYMR